MADSTNKTAMPDDAPPTPPASMMKKATDEIDRLRAALVRIRRTANRNRNADWRLAEMARIATEALDG